MGEHEIAGVLQQRLGDLVGQVRRGDAMVRADDPAGVHDLRVAMRRTRSLLRTFRGVLPERQRAETERLRGELRWAGGELGTARDVQIVRQRVASRLEARRAGPGPAAAGPGPTTSRELLEHRLATLDDRARERVGALFACARYRQLLDALDEAASDVDWSAATRATARDSLRTDWRRMRRRARYAADQPDPDDQPDATDPGVVDREARLHDVRKAAKRARYAAETLIPVLGRKAARMAAAAEQVQESLGTHRDTVLTRRLLAELATDSGDGATGFALGRLHAQEEAAGEAAIADYREARAETDRKRHRRWLR